jgi:hypothetical protein
MKRVLAGIVGVTALALTASTQAATNKGVEGSPHDFSASDWNTRQGVCSPCHAAHNTDPAQIAPLWTHATSQAAFTPYSSSSMNASVGNPSGTSLACLSCHDGTVGVNSFISGVSTGGLTTGPVYIGSWDPQYQIGPDLHTTHPISFTYNAALATADGALENPDTYHIGDPKTNLTYSTAPVPTSWSGTSLTGKTIKQAMLSGTSGYQMECSSCHDVHKLDGSAPSSGILARLSGNDSGNKGSILCRTCHIK